MKEQLHLKNHLKEVRTAANLSQTQLAEMVGVSRNTISSIETGQFNPTAKLALILCIALDKKFEELFYFALQVLLSDIAQNSGSLNNYARDRYSPVLVSILILSPWLTNRGTATVAPVSTVAGLLAPVAVSPLNPGSVSVISSSTNRGGSTENTLPLWEQILHISFSFTNFSASPTVSEFSAT